MSKHHNINFDTSEHILNVDRRYYDNGQVFVFTWCGKPKSLGEVFTGQYLIVKGKDAHKKTACMECVIEIRKPMGKVA